MLNICLLVKIYNFFLRNIKNLFYILYQHVIFYICPFFIFFILNTIVNSLFLKFVIQKKYSIKFDYSNKFLIIFLPIIKIEGNIIIILIILFR